MGNVLVQMCDQHWRTLIQGIDAEARGLRFSDQTRIRHRLKIPFRKIACQISRGEESSAGNKPGCGVERPDGLPAKRKPDGFRGFA